MVQYSESWRWLQASKGVADIIESKGFSETLMGCSVKHRSKCHGMDITNLMGNLGDFVCACVF